MTKKEIKIQKALEYLNLSEEPLCYCGNQLEFYSKFKDQTPSGGWRKYCSRACMTICPKVIQKRKKTTLERFGVESYSQIQEFKKWNEETKEQYKEKSKKTFLEKYGVEHHSQTPEYLEKRSKTNIEKYGVENTWSLVKNANPFFASEEGNKWLKSENNPGPEQFRKNREKKLLEKIKDSVFVNIIIAKDREAFKNYIHSLASKIDSPNRFSIAQEIGFSTSHLNALFRKYGLDDQYISKIYQSNGEIEVIDFIKSLGLKTEEKNRKILGGLEVDILIPSKNLAIEYNGLYWHSEGSAGKDKNYHLNKTNLLEENGIQLLHILDVEWNNPVKQKIWKSIIKAKLGLLNNKIYARNCISSKISPKQAREFLDQNHLEGFVGAKEHYGLFHNKALVSVISYGKSRFSDNENEVIRFASLKDHLVIGGYSKLLKEYRLEGNLTSYANRRFSSVLTLNKFFNNFSISGPNWYGYNRSDYELKHRLSFTKQKLMTMFNYDETLTSFENMLKNGYDRIWDSGNIKYFR